MSLVREVSVECPGQKPDCRGSSEELEGRKSWAVRSNNLKEKGIRVIDGEGWWV